ncbi:DUF192 domain-containing protein [Paenarthrobacter ureafaciens]|uniref:DUF192 domain-containing protein n=1 Tax=Paenarthrobacter ureafaciens TaxID=37931 RepID=UPI0034641677
MKVPRTSAAALATLLTGCAAMPQSSTAVVSIGAGAEFQVELARTAEEQRNGLSGRPELSEGTGMLFTFGNRAERQVWMAGMAVPIDVAWIVDDQVLALDTLDPCTKTDRDQCPRWTSPGDVDALLEVPAGALDGIETGTAVTVRP